MTDDFRGDFCIGSAASDLIPYLSGPGDLILKEPMGIKAGSRQICHKGANIPVWDHSYPC